MNIAEDIGHSLAVEADAAFGARLVQAKVESFAVVKRKDIMKERVMVRKLHRAANRDNHQMRIELFVFLHHPKCMRRWS